MSEYETIEDALALGTGTERAFKCHVHGERRASASVNALTGLWVCYVCGAKGKIGVENIEISPDAVLRELSRVREMLEDDRHVVYPEGWLSQYDAAGPGDYWLSRFAESTCKHFRLGMDVKGDHATYPLRDNEGRVLGVVKRNLVDPDGPKYRYPLWIDISRFIFNIHAATGDTLLLTEGATDAIAAWEVGAVDSVALYGSRLSRSQYRVLRRYGPVRLLCAFDQDNAGNSASEAVIRAFPDLDVQRLTWSGDKDLASLDPENRAEVLDRAGVSRLGSAPCESNAESKTSSPPSSPPTRTLRLRLERPVHA